MQSKPIPGTSYSIVVVQDNHTFGCWFVVGSVNQAGVFAPIAWGKLKEIQQTGALLNVPEGELMKLLQGAVLLSELTEDEKKLLNLPK